jgi:uncharacterized protein YbdZ (MbtH family)
VTENPFENTASMFLVLVNARGQHSLWPSAVPSPAGWTVTYGEASRDDCTDYVDKHWTGVSHPNRRE